MLTELGWTRAVTSGAFSLSITLYGLLAIGMGRLTDKFGPRLVITACGLFFGLGYLLMSQITAVWHLYLFYGVIIAIGGSGLYVPLISTVARWFVRRRGVMTGIVVSGIGLGNAHTSGSELAHLYLRLAYLLYYCRRDSSGIGYVDGTVFSA